MTPIYDHINNYKMTKMNSQVPSDSVGVNDSIQALIFEDKR